MKVTVRESYTYKNVVVVPENSAYAQDYVVDMPVNEVMEILKTQVQFEALQQQLQPIMEAMKETEKMRREVEEAQKAVQEAESEVEVSN